MEQPAARGRFGLAWAVGLALAAPIGWLMAPVAVLPYFLGIYFFMLIGLLLGALLYRLALPAAPVSRGAAHLLGTATAAVLWLACLMGEYRYLYQAAFQAVKKSTRIVLTPERSEEVRKAIEGDVRAQLKRDYPPGGLPGYVRWAAARGTMQIPRVFDQLPITYVLPSRGWRWTARVALSLMLTIGAILSQVAGLARSPQPDGDTAKLSEKST